MAYDIVLLDADMTLFDFDAAERVSLQKVLTDRGLPFDQPVLEAYMRINWELWAAYSRGELDMEQLNSARFGRLFAQLGSTADPAQCGRDYTAALAEASQLLPGAEDFCRRLKQAGKTLAIVTNGLAGTQRRRVQRSGLAQYMDGLFISEEMGTQKPMREYFSHVFAALPVPDPGRCVIMGDNLRSDILGGIQAGIDSIWYNPNGWPGDPEICPTWEARDYESALHFILHGENAQKKPKST